ncbi:MAG: carboxypeptidase-like regulatory domain-containing protein [Myxococcales bacterium]
MTYRRLLVPCLAGSWLALGSGCGKESDKPAAEEAGPVMCDPAMADACEQGLLCEEVGEQHLCLPPVVVRGHVIEALNQAGIVGATVVGLDANGAARTRVSVSSVDGAYELPVSVKRNPDGSPTTDHITLRVAAADHQAFPTPPRLALAIEIETAQAEPVGDAGSPSTNAGISDQVRWVVSNAATEVALIPLSEAQRGGTTVTGHVVAEDPGAVLVLAQAGDQVRSSAITDLDGAFTLFNVPVGASSLEGYRANIRVMPKAVTVPATGLTDVELQGTTGTLATVRGNINIVDAAGGGTTSVILVVASTFDADAARGEAPAGLRAGNVSSAFEIKGVPPGRYAVLAAFENDSLVRDPDEAIAGTDIAFVDVGSTDVNVDQGFKVTGALAVVGPGADKVESVPAGKINLRWADDSSEDGYELRVYDALGNQVFEKTDVARVTGTSTVSFELDASSYQPGMVYQFRVKSWREMKGNRTYISATEDLRGVFEIAH